MGPICSTFIPELKGSLDPPPNENNIFTIFLILSTTILLDLLIDALFDMRNINMGKKIGAVIQDGRSLNIEVPTGPLKL